MKLYRVTVEMEFVAWAEDEFEARQFADEARRDAYDWDVYASEMTGALPIGWSENDLVYTSEGGDITIAMARELMMPPPDAPPTAAELEAAGQMRLIDNAERECVRLLTETPAAK